MGQLALVGVPTSAGTHGPGQEKAPRALRRAGLTRRLEAAGVALRDEGDLPEAMYRAAAADPRQRDLDGVLYFDGDADLSTPATTRSGVLDSMVVAHLLGEGAPELARLGPRVPLLPADRLLAELEARVGTVVVHFDVDVVDSGDLPLANFPHFGQGLSLADALACLEVFLAGTKLGGPAGTRLGPVTNDSFAT